MAGFNTPIDFSTPTFAGKLTLFPLYTKYGKPTTGQSATLYSSEKENHLPGPARMSVLFEFNKLPPTGTKFQISGVDQTKNPVYTVDLIARG